MKPSAPYQMTSWHRSTGETESPHIFPQPREMKRGEEPRESESEEQSCCCKPSSLLLKDKDKLLSFSVPQGVSKAEPDPRIILSRKRKWGKSNAWNSANNCSTTLLKYLRPSVSFFLTVFPLSCCSCHYYSPRNNNMGRLLRRIAGKRFLRECSLVMPILLFLILTKIIPLSNATPIPSIPPPPPTQVVKHTAEGAGNLDENNMRGYDAVKFSLQRRALDATLSTFLEEEWDKRQIQDNFNTETNEVSSSFRNASEQRSPAGQGDDIHSGGGGSSSLLKFTFSSGQLPNRSSSSEVEKEEEKVSTHLQHQPHEAVMTMPLAIPSQKRNHQRGPLTPRVTNGISRRAQNISNSSGGGGGDASFVLKNSINDDDDDISKARAGNCWPVVKNKEEEESAKAISFPGIMPSEGSIAVVCNGTSHLELALSQIQEKFVPQVISIDVKDSSISRLNLSLFHRFPRLESLSVTRSNVTQIIGTCQGSLKALNISFNAVKKLNDSVFLGDEDEGEAENTEAEDEAKVGDNTTNFSLKRVSTFPSSSSQQHNESSIPKFTPPSRLNLGQRNYNTEKLIKARQKDPQFTEKLGLPQLMPPQLVRNNSGNDDFKGSPGEGGFIGATESSNESDDDDDDDDDFEMSDSSWKRGKTSERVKASASTSQTNTICPDDSIGNCIVKASITEQTEEKFDHPQLSQSSDVGKSSSYNSYEEEEVGSESGDYYVQYRGPLSSTNTFTNRRTLTTEKDSLGGNSDRNVISQAIFDKASTTMSSNKRTTFLSSLEDIDLSHNKVSEIPRALLHLKSLKSLRLSGNHLKCEFVWEKLADWYMKSEDPHILKDGDDTLCGFVNDVRHFQYTVLGVFKAKKDLAETCRTVDKTICHECGLYTLLKQPGYGYNFSHQSPRGNVAIALKLDCSNRNLVEMPRVPLQTWQLNVSGNFITDLNQLKDPMYKNLLILDADANEISTLEGLTGTTFLDRYNFLSLQNNRFDVIPTHILSSLKNMRGQGVTFLGANSIECDCDVLKEIKPLLLENSKKIKDSKEIYCKDMKTSSGETFMPVEDLKYTDLCYMDTEESNEMYLYLIIVVELLLIVLIVAKVWHDQRTFRRTGILPWCSAKMPRLPCDAMLESVKEPPHFNRSSSTNVRSFTCEPPTQSISSHVQLKEVRSNSGQSEKSSQISQLSSFPSSSRTSSV